MYFIVCTSKSQLCDRDIQKLCTQELGLMGTAHVYGDIAVTQVFATQLVREDCCY